MAVGQGPATWLQRRAALASTLVADLELCRDGIAMLEQDAFGRVLVEPFASVRDDALRARTASCR